MKLKAFILSLIILFLGNTAFAFINCQPKYDNDKRSLPSLRGSCGVCHINPNGSGPQNAFGNAFKNAGFMITDELVEKFPNLFKKPEPVTTPTPPQDNNSVGASSTSSGSASQAAPIIKRIKPNKVKINIQTMAAIMGQNFIEGTKAFVDNNEVLTTVKSKVLLLIDFVLNSPGLHNVKVQTPDGQESNTVKIMAR